MKRGCDGIEYDSDAELDDPVTRWMEGMLEPVDKLFTVNNLSTDLEKVLQYRESVDCRPVKICIFQLPGFLPNFNADSVHGRCAT